MSVTQQQRRSGRIVPGDRVVWVGDDDLLPVGSSIKARAVTSQRVAIDPIQGTDAERRNDIDWRKRGVEIVSCEEAARRGIEPWVSSLPPSMNGTYERDPDAPHKPTPDILSLGPGGVRQHVEAVRGRAEELAPVDRATGAGLAHVLAEAIAQHFAEAEQVKLTNAERDQLAEHLVSYGVSWVMGLKGLT